MKKIRGHKRHWKAIENWVARNAHLNMEALEQYDRDYAKLHAKPWDGIYMALHQIPEPKGETKLRIIEGLIHIYKAWYEQLEALNEPYYLRIWLFEPRISSSQVVCAIRRNLHFYDHTFSKPENNMAFMLNYYGRLNDKLTEFNWEHRLDEDHFDDMELGNPEDFASEQAYLEHKRWFKKLMKKPHKTTQLNSSSHGPKELYSFTKGCVWLGYK